MDIKPLPENIYDKAKELGVTEILLEFQGGSDNGYLSVSIWSSQKGRSVGELEREIERWAWDVYEYYGAGDGNDYGDNITYNLYQMTATWSEWYTDRVDGSSSESEFEVVKSEQEVTE